METVAVLEIIKLALLFLNNYGIAALSLAVLVFFAYIYGYKHSKLAELNKYYLDKITNLTEKLETTRNSYDRVVDELDAEKQHTAFFKVFVSQRLAEYLADQGNKQREAKIQSETQE
ncbi:MAG: hypothetical protein LBO03_04420 [Acidaminococcales bacterium]|jgi:hypothetical protein|nr:hypothetical protein [Acidaminococcales bacterium]